MLVRRFSRQRSVPRGRGVCIDMTTMEETNSMTETASPALRTALAYYHAWTSHDLDEAMSYIADDIVCDAPAGRLEGAAAYRGFMGPFVQILTGSELIAAFGDDTTALIMYDTETVPVRSAPGAECLTVSDGKITYSRFIFDRAPFDAARAQAAT
jgi:SnoaL-like domain